MTRLEDMTIRQIRAELKRLLTMSVLADLPAPTRTHDDDQPMPGWEWEVDGWRIFAGRNPDDAIAVYVRVPGWDDAVLPILLADAGRFAAAVMAAITRSERILNRSSSDELEP